MAESISHFKLASSHTFSKHRWGAFKRIAEDWGVLISSFSDAHLGIDYAMVQFDAGYRTGHQ